MAERWDILLRVLDGPLAGGEQVLRGPVVPLGASPGPGGLVLQGYRGLEPRHATITAYDAGQVAIAPVGTAQVRQAPHPNVSWEEIQPLGGPAVLSEGCALHLGPVGRGATLQYLGARELGAWASGDLASAAEAAGGSPSAHRVQRIPASRVPFWFVGCLLVMVVTFTVVLLAVVFLGPEPHEPLGPVEEGEPFYRFADVPRIDTLLLKGVDQPFAELVMGPNAEAAGQPRLRDPSSWDREFHDRVAASMQVHLRSFNFFRRLEVVRGDYAYVLEELRDADLPEVFAAIPYLESQYHADKQSPVCAKGYWQFMPETAWRIGRETDLTFRIQDCRFRDAPGLLWNPTERTPPRGVSRNAEYVDQTLDLEARDPKRCRIEDCAVDDRTDLQRSTAAALLTLREAWEDPDLRASGALVQLVILSHNAGYDDRRFGVDKPNNVLPAYLAWREGQPRIEWPRFYGDNITTRRWDELGWNGSKLAPEAQHYAYSVVAEHVIAICYYAQNHGDEPAFRAWRPYVRTGGYCQELAVPTPEQARAGRR